ncbi:dihydrofolate reductase family protein [Dyadobacter sp. CY312]|uniref:dihydrofolate reductase family protein n=1 Tax=Dyadobacter sp. CY312 TaxID=2907303 RepID=UPI001F48392D|nr:dihydrofolate reductase family protein [Dyadobacter sp. CY312]MCE7040299.1 dihydrofolate reductase family protein [Dyadobacter sp. CY312]
MRKLKLQVQISVDGFVARTDGQLDWTVSSDEQLWQLINELPDSSDTLLLGRKMAEDFIPHFESFEPENVRFPFAQKMVNIPKIIFTKTLKKPFGKNTSLAKGNLTDEILEMKNQIGKDILVYGGAGFVSSLIAGGYIDELYLFVNPVMIHKGLRIFDLLTKEQKLTLISATPYECGVTVLRYELKKEG